MIKQIGNTLKMAGRILESLLTEDEAIRQIKYKGEISRIYWMK